MKLIDKDALVAEIERKADIICQGVLSEEATMSVEYFKDSLISFLDTLEVKEVDLEKYYHEFLQKEWFGNSYVRTVSEMMAFIAKHFFELGLKVNKSLTWEDIANLNEIVSEMLKECGENILYDTQEDFCKEVLKRFKAQKGE